MQFRVDLGLEPQIENRSYVLWVLTRRKLASVLVSSIDLHSKWTMCTSSYSSSYPEEKFHPTARARSSVPAPLRTFLEMKIDSRETPGLVLYHGMGRDTMGLAALSRKGRDEVIGYDPFHPKPERRLLPPVQFDEVVSIYTLNVVPAVVGVKILGEMYDVLKPQGTAVIAVRRDL